VLHWIATTPVAEALKGSALLYMGVNASHILSIALLIGAILPLDLRLVGFCPQIPLDRIGPFLAGCAATGLALALVTGALLFTVRPAEYAGNPAFLAKLALVALGLVNVAATRLSGAWRRALDKGTADGWMRLFALLSAVLWTATLLAGRWIGFI
jgi:hypothetical protein